MVDRRFYTSPRCLHNPRCCHRAVGCYFWYIPESCKIRHGNIAPYHAAEDQVESKWLGTLIRKIFLITSWAKVQLECSDGWLTVEVIAMIWHTQSVFLCFSRGKSLLLPTISAVSVSNVGRNWQREPAGREHKEPEWFPSEFETQWGYRVGEVGMGISRACRPVIVSESCGTLSKPVFALACA